MPYELPLFPLNSVLFPGMPLTLHIFEERYRQMIRVCLAKQQPFGVVLIQEGQEALGPPATPHQIGCTAEIAHRQELPGGRMNLLVMGRERFRIRDTLRDRPYLLGSVEEYPVRISDPAALRAQAVAVRGLVERYLTLLNQAEVADYDVSRLPHDPVALAYLGAGLLQVSNERKQLLLAVEEGSALLADLGQLFRVEVPLLRLLLDEARKQSEGPESFSLN